MPSQLQRHSVYLPEQLAQEFYRCVEDAGVPKSTVLYSLLRDAARLGVTHPELLPKERRAPRGKLGKRSEEKWTQGTPEFRRWADVFEGAGSSFAAVARWMVELYLAAGGDPLAMEWPPKTGAVRAA